MRSMASGGALRKTWFGQRLHEWSDMEQGCAYLVEGMRLDLGELVFHVIGVHCADLFPSRGAKNLDDFHQLVNS